MQEHRFALELNEEQLRLVSQALEEYCRIRMDQWDILADSLAEKNVDLSANNPNHERTFADFLRRRADAKKLLEKAGAVLWGGTDNRKSHEQLIAEDIWRVIRHQLYLASGSKDTSRVDAYPPLFVSGEPKPVCHMLAQEADP